MKRRTCNNRNSVVAQSLRFAVSSRSSLDSGFAGTFKSVGFFARRPELRSGLYQPAFPAFGALIRS